MTKEKQYEFAVSEHLAGFHKIYYSNCSECYRENRLLTAKRNVDLGTPVGYERRQIDDPRFTWNNNPIRD